MLWVNEDPHRVIDGAVELELRLTGLEALDAMGRREHVPRRDQGAGAAVAFKAVADQAHAGEAEPSAGR